VDPGTYQHMPMAGCRPDADVGLGKDDHADSSSANHWLPSNKMIVYSTTQPIYCEHLYRSYSNRGTSGARTHCTFTWTCTTKRCPTLSPGRTPTILYIRHQPCRTTTSSGVEMVDRASQTSIISLRHHRKECLKDQRAYARVVLCNCSLRKVQITSIPLLI